MIAVCALLFSQPLFYIGVKFANRHRLLDHPSPRRRHRKPTPIIGGVLIFLTWIFAVLLYSFFHQNWLATNLPSLLPMICSLVMLIVLVWWTMWEDWLPDKNCFFRLWRPQWWFSSILALGGPLSWAATHHKTIPAWAGPKNFWNWGWELKRTGPLKSPILREFCIDQSL